MAVMNYEVSASGFKVYKDGALFADKHVTFINTPDLQKIELMAKQFIDRVLLYNELPQQYNTIETDVFIKFPSAHTRIDKIAKNGGGGGNNDDSPVFPNTFEYTAHDTSFSQYAQMTSPNLFLFDRKDGSGLRKSTLDELNGNTTPYIVSIFMDYAITGTLTGDEESYIAITSNGDAIENKQVPALAGTSGTTQIDFLINNTNNIGARMAYGGLTPGTSISFTNRRIVFNKQTP